MRKLAHYVLFALGGFVIYWGLELCFDTKHKVLISIFCGMLMACIDEFHQLYSSNRGPRISDVALDTLGVVSGVLAAKIIVEIIKKFIIK